MTDHPAPPSTLSPRPRPAVTGDAERARAQPRITSEELLGSHSRLIIVHEGAEYQLQRTSRGKLILTK